MVTEPAFVTQTRDGYDCTAAIYAERFHDHLDDKPVDLAMISAFAGLAAQGSNRPVVDVGCGTGVTTALLAASGLDVIGIDLSPNMIGQAQRLNPDISFHVGSMLELDVVDGSAGGVCAWYSTIHVADSHLGAVFDEFHRVLAPGGLVLLAFQVGDEPRVLTGVYGRQVQLTFIRRQPQAVEDLLSRSGFRNYAQFIRQPDVDGFESTPHAYLIARRT